MEQALLNRRVLADLKRRLGEGLIDMEYIQSERRRCEDIEDYALAIAIREAVKQL